MLDSLKLPSWLLWPGDRMQERYEQFLALSAMKLISSLERRKNHLLNSIFSSEAFRKDHLRRTEMQLQKLWDELLTPIGVSHALLQASEGDLMSELPRRVEKIRTTATAIEFILRYNANLGGYRRGASLTKFIEFIGKNGYSKRGICRDQKAFYKAWGEYKSISYFCFVDVFLDGPFHKYNLSEEEPCVKVDGFFSDDESKNKYFGTGLFVENFMTNFKTYGAKDSLICRNRFVSFEKVSGVSEYNPQLPEFSASEKEIIDKYRTRVQLVVKNK